MLALCSREVANKYLVQTYVETVLIRLVDKTVLEQALRQFLQRQKISDVSYVTKPDKHGLTIIDKSKSEHNLFRF